MKQVYAPGCALLIYKSELAKKVLKFLNEELSVINEHLICCIRSASSSLGKDLKIEQAVSMTEEKLADNRMMCYKCQSEIGGELKPFEIKFELGTSKWYLWKM